MGKEPKLRPQTKHASDTLVSVRTPGNVRQCVSVVWATQHSPDKLTEPSLLFNISLASNCVI